MGKKVRARPLIAYLSVLALAPTLPLLAVAWIAVTKFADSERQRLETVANDLSQDTMGRIDREVTARIAMLKALATSAALDAGDTEAFHRQASSLADAEEMVISLRDREGRPLVNTRVQHGSPLPPSGDLNSVGEVRNGKSIHISDLFLGSLNQRPLLAVTVPAIRDGEMKYALTASLPSEFISQALMASIPEGPFHVVLADRIGTIIAHSREGRGSIGQTLPNFAQTRSAPHGNVSGVSEGGARISGYWRRSDVSGWTVISGVDEAALAAPLQRSITVLIGIVAQLGLLALALAAWVANRLSRAHQLLGEAAQRVGAGEVLESANTGLKEADIVGEYLAEASVQLRQQAEALEQAKAELETRVELRTGELAEKSALFETTLESMAQGLIAVGADGRVSVCNRRARELLELPDHFMETRPATSTVMAFLNGRMEFDGTPPEILRRLQMHWQGDEFSVYERQRPNGAVLEVRTVPGPNGGFVRTFTDVTERRRQARELEQAKEEAEQANRTKTEFLATMSHELRTPLNSIIGYTDILLVDGALGEAERGHVECVQKSGAGLLSLVSDILDFAKLEAGAIEFHPYPFRFSDLVNEAISATRHSAERAQLDLQVDTSAVDHNWFVGDVDRLRQILLNLLSNAIKFTPAGSVSLTVEGSDEGVFASRLTFTIADTGIGIPEPNQARLFQRFSQSDPNISRRFGGTGLGLAICKQLVEHMGGTIGLSSAPGHGSVVSFSVVLSKAGEDAVAAQALTEMPQPNDGVPARVLVVEDVAANQDIIRALLESAGHVADVVDNGTDAIAAVQTGDYDLVLMDLRMPGMDGVEATQRIRRLDHPARSVPIVGCTANVIPGQLVEFSRAGLDSYLLKPLRRSELKAAVSKYGRHRHSGDPAPWAGSSAEMERHDYDEMMELLGPAKMDDALEELRQNLEFILSYPRTGEHGSDVALRAHSAISTARLIGMTSLARRCAKLENACADPRAMLVVLKELQPFIREALQSVEQLRCTISHSTLRECG